MSDSVLPHRRQPTRLPRPWDSQGKNIGVGCHFLLQLMKVKSLSRVRLLVTPWTAAYQAPGSMVFSRQEYWSRVPLPSLWSSLIICYCYSLKSNDQLFCKMSLNLGLPDYFLVIKCGFCIFAKDPTQPILCLLSDLVRRFSITQG